MLFAYLCKNKILGHVLYFSRASICYWTFLYAMGHFYMQTSLLEKETLYMKVASTCITDASLNLMRVQLSYQLHLTMNVAVEYHPTTKHRGQCLSELIDKCSS